MSGDAYQYMWYSPWGEGLVDQYSNTGSYSSPYRFSGKELDPETNNYYYGARYYNPQISQWLSVDPMASEAPGWTPYRFCFDNPINVIDPDGQFELDPKTAKNNPKLVAHLKGMKEAFMNKPEEFKQAFYKTSGLSEAETLDMLTYGSGPKVEVENLDSPTKKVNGSTIAYKDAKTGEIKNGNNGKGLIKLDDDVVGMLENSSTYGDEEAGNLMVESTLLHEGTHFGNVKNNKNGNGAYTESGKAFEKAAYGQDIGRSNVQRVNNERQAVTINPKSIDNVSVY